MLRNHCRKKVRGDFVIRFLCAAISLAVILFFTSACSGKSGRAVLNTQNEMDNTIHVYYDADFYGVDRSAVDTVAAMLQKEGMTVKVHSLSGGNYAPEIMQAIESGCRGLVVALPYGIALDEAISHATGMGIKVLELFSRQFDSTVSVSLDAHNAGYLLGKRLGESLIAANINAPRVALAMGGDKLLETGFNEGLCELLPETVISLKLTGGGQPEALGDLLEQELIDAVAVLCLTEALVLTPVEMEHVSYVMFTPHPSQPPAIGEFVLVSRLGSAISAATVQFINSLTGKRVDQQAFYFENAFEHRGL